MPNLNKVMLIGTLTRDPEVKFTPKGTAVADVGIAINHPFTANGEKREETTFVDVELWGKTAELAGEYLKKGKPVFIEGRLKLETWDDKTTGQKRSKMKVVGESMQFLGSKDSAPGFQRASAPANRPSQRPSAPPPGRDPDLDPTDGDIGF